ncbi:hypothetical protein SNEBB_008029 [Seison nebaliae]|nr:hypothetical protein SNEBB_008029 [Seison nebaliae]
MTSQIRWLLQKTYEFKWMITFFLISSWNEYFIYNYTSSKWATIPKKFENAEIILIISDPQLIGNKNEKPLLKYITIFDSDSYLNRYFVRISTKFNFSTIIFLGDLFDEGIEANENDFEIYFHRFRQIFSIKQLEKEKKNLIYLPGDNDIGGEYPFLRDKTICKKFLKYFQMKHQNNFYSFNNFEIFQMDMDYFSLIKSSEADVTDRPIQKSLLRTKSNFNYERNDEDRKELMMSVFQQRNDSFRPLIVANHWPLSPRFDEVNLHLHRLLSPSITFSGDFHKTVLYLDDLESGELRVVGEFCNQHQYDDAKFNFNCYNKFMNLRLFGRLKGEIVVPTMSYRMGVKHPGVGVLLINKDDIGQIDLLYTVLWLSDRYYSLNIYLTFFCCLISCKVLFYLIMFVRFYCQ